MMGNGLPQPPEEFKPELHRRLALLDREIQALDTDGTQQAHLASLEALHLMETKLLHRLDGEIDAGEWETTRVEILAAWRQYRRAFERLAAQCGRLYAVRARQRDRGPRW